MITALATLGGLTLAHGQESATTIAVVALIVACLSPVVSILGSWLVLRDRERVKTLRSDVHEIDVNLQFKKERM